MHSRVSNSSPTRPRYRNKTTSSKIRLYTTQTSQQNDQLSRRHTRDLDLISAPVSTYTQNLAEATWSELTPTHMPGVHIYFPLTHTMRGHRSNIPKLINPSEIRTKHRLARKSNGRDKGSDAFLNSRMLVFQTSGNRRIWNPTCKHCNLVSNFRIIDTHLQP